MRDVLPYGGAMKARAIGCVVGAVVVGGGVLGAACGGKATSVTCGAGTQLVGTTCVAGDAGGGGAKDGGAGDARAAETGGVVDGSLDALETDGGGGVDSGGDGDGAGPSDDGATADAADASMPLPCGDVNACVAMGSLPGPVDMGFYDTCGGVSSGPGQASGNQSGWLKLTYRNSCNSTVMTVELSSDPAILFDMDVYEVLAPVPPVPLTTCPALLASAMTQIYDSGRAIASVDVQSVGDLYIHVVARSGAQCTTDALWHLGAYGR